MGWDQSNTSNESNWFTNWWLTDSSSQEVLRSRGPVIKFLAAKMIWLRSSSRFQHWMRSKCQNLFLLYPPGNLKVVKRTGKIRYICLRIFRDLSTTVAPSDKKKQVATPVFNPRRLILIQLLLIANYDLQVFSSVINRLDQLNCSMSFEMNLFIRDDFTRVLIGLRTLTKFIRISYHCDRFWNFSWIIFTAVFNQMNCWDAFGCPSQ